jgi:hypothetical protein
VAVRCGKDCALPSLTLCLLPHTLSASAPHAQVTGQWCGEPCEALDCQEFPASDDVPDKWWYCSDCRLYGFTSYVKPNGDGYIVCPDDSVTFFKGLPDATEAQLLDVCNAQCTDLGFAASNDTTAINFGPPTHHYAFYNDRRTTAL